jgi:glycine dehydrogenase subunit 1
MGSYVPNTVSQQDEMLKVIGCNGFDDLFKQIPNDVLLKSELNIPEGLSELEVAKKISDLSSKNKVYQTIYRGVGAYRHYIPSIVKQVTSKEEFMTAYTPYQAEISQGVLQSIFEYQTMICELTGMDVSNASVYDGATAAAEAVIMCLEKNKSKMIVAETINPQILETIKTLCCGMKVEFVLAKEKGGIVDVDYLESIVDGETAGILIQHPNYYGLFEDASIIGELAKKCNARYVIHSNPMALGIMKTPREYGADIAVGEGQPLGLPLSFGGPYLGFMATTDKLVRKLPGRIAGETKDSEGRRAFVLTLQAREQHIRREKASSNICSNQALCAMTAAVYLSAMGKEGLVKAGTLSMSKAHYLAKRLCDLPNFTMTFSSEYFHEFATKYEGNIDRLLKGLDANGILGGYPLKGKYEGSLVWCTTELNTKEEIDELITLIGKVESNGTNL